MVLSKIVLIVSLLTACDCTAQVQVSETGLYSVTATVSYMHEDPVYEGRTYVAGAGGVVLWFVGSAQILQLDAQGNPAACSWTVVTPSNQVLRKGIDCPVARLFQDGFESGNTNAWSMEVVA